MLSLGHQRWLHTNLVAKSFSNVTDPFEVKFDIKTPTLNFDFNSAADYTAKLIADKYVNLHVCLSGGLDSEFVAAVLLRNGIPFVPVIVPTLSSSESWFAFKFCHENKLTPIVFDFSNKTKSGDSEFVMDNLITKACRIATALKVPIEESLIPNIVVELLLDPTAKMLTGYGEPFPNHKHFHQPLGNTMELSDHDYYLNLEYDDLHPGSFFTYTPEIFKAMVKDIDTTANVQIAKAKLYGLPERCKSYSFFESSKSIMGLRSHHIHELYKKFWRDEHLRNVNIDRQTLLSML